MMLRKAVTGIAAGLAAAAVVMTLGLAGCGGDNGANSGDDDDGEPSAKTYTITFNANGGTVSPTSDKTGTDGKLTSLPTPTRSDYTFDGWYTAATGGDSVTLNKVYSANTTIYARWTEIGGGGYTGTYGSVTHGGKTYKTVKIGTQTWMAENLDYNVEGSKCYNNSADSCAKYGRLYDWAVAMSIDASYNDLSWNGSDINHQGICPSGWHLPSTVDLDTLVNFIGKWESKKLKSTSGWLGSDGNGTDEFGFSALPGGVGHSSGNFGTAGYLGSWWSATEYDAVNAYDWDMWSHTDGVIFVDIIKTRLHSVRCVED